MEIENDRPKRSYFFFSHMHTLFLLETGLEAIANSFYFRN